MTHATELIRQIIRKHGLHLIYPGQDDSSFSDLHQTAWCQIERTLYKYRSRPHCRACFNFNRPADSVLSIIDPKSYRIITIPEVLNGVGNRPPGVPEWEPGDHVNVRYKRICPRCHSSLTDNSIINPAQGVYGGTRSILYRGCSKVFNMWSQIAKTVILAFIKKEARDRKNSGNYKDHIVSKYKVDTDVIDRFMAEASEVCKYNDDYMLILEQLYELMKTDDKPHDGIIGKLVIATGLSRPLVTGFFKYIRMRGAAFSDSPINRARDNNNLTDDGASVDGDDE